MSRVLFPSSIICTINKPLDGKTNVLTINERNAIPIPHRYKGMMLVVQNTGAINAQLFWLPTGDLSNNGWEEIDVGSESVGVLVPDWIPNVNYVKFQVVVFDGILYRCKESHLASSDFEESAMYWLMLGGGIRNIYTHLQAAPSDTWLIQHNFNTNHLALTLFIINDENEQVVGKVNIRLSTNNLLVYEFSEPLTGKAFIKY